MGDLVDDLGRFGGCFGKGFGGCFGKFHLIMLVRLTIWWMFWEIPSYYACSLDYLVDVLGKQPPKKHNY